MMRSRWLSTFTLLGILLVILGIVGKVIGPRFIYDPGQIPDGNEALCYIVVGGLMLLNGFLSPAISEDAENEAPAPVAVKPASPASPTREALATAAEDRTAE